MTKDLIKDKNEIGKHIPIMLEDVINGLNIKPDDLIIDCTANRGGHSKEFLKYINEDGLLICNDLDNIALDELKNDIQLTYNNKNVVYSNDNFADIKNILQKNNILKVDKIFADLGVSSQDIDKSGRGFTFMKDEPLLMTYFNEVDDNKINAMDIVNNWSENIIADILYNFADETYGRRIAKEIINARKNKKISTTFDLVEIIRNSTPSGYHNRKTHFATKTFQALRMATNREIDNIISLIASTNQILSLGGRIAIITFHSIEDRIVKQKAKEFGLKMLTKKPISPNRKEVLENRRSRSAKLRIYEYNI
jgi:16S rRNA (cytosine1402-N4)-methyltransferase